MLITGIFFFSHNSQKDSFKELFQVSIESYRVIDQSNDFDPYLMISLVYKIIFIQMNMTKLLWNCSKKLNVECVVPHYLSQFCPSTNSLHSQAPVLESHLG